MQIVVRTMEELRQYWNSKQNFIFDPDFFRLEMELPPAVDIVDVLRREKDSVIAIKGDYSEAEQEHMVEKFKTRPIEQVIDYPFTLSHFELAKFYGADQFLHDFQNKIMAPWRTFLASTGLTWQRCYPIFFISGKQCTTGYHVDVSHVVAWQVYGTKVFNGYVDPEKYAPIEVCVDERDRIQWKERPACPAEEVISYEMQPGALLWNQLLTPHWVEASDEIAVSVNISHGGVRYKGEFCDNEQSLRARWDKHPQEAWLTDLRY